MQFVYIPLEGLFSQYIKLCMKWRRENFQLTRQFFGLAPAEMDTPLFSKKESLPGVLSWKYVTFFVT